MIVIADSSPLIVLVNIDCVDVLMQLFGQIVIPAAVASELDSPRRPKLVRDFVAALPTWIKVQHPISRQKISELHLGESDAIILAMELNADLVLIDERKGYREAISRKLNAIGTVGVLERGAAAGFLDLADTFEKLKQTDFWISHQLLDERLRLNKKMS